LFAYFLVWGVGIPLFKIQVTLLQMIDLAVFAFILVAALTGVISIIFAFAKTRSQAQSIAPAVILGFSMLGGAMIPVNNLPQFIQRIAVISPVYWGIDAMHKITLENASLSGISQHLLILISLSIVLLVPSLMIQQRKYRS
jgi:ABC-2 type transport system permease protein